MAELQLMESTVSEKGVFVKFLLTLHISFLYKLPGQSGIFGFSSLVLGTFMSIVNLQIDLCWETMTDHFVLYMLMVASNKHTDFPYILLVRYVTEQVSLTIE